MDTQHFKSSELVVILDAGSQYAKLIDRKVRELSVESIILPLNVLASELSKHIHLGKGLDRVAQDAQLDSIPESEPKLIYKAIIISGGPQSVYAEDAPDFDWKIFDLGIPILGICYGMQLMCLHAGQKVGKKLQREDGQFDIEVDTLSNLFQNLEPRQSVLLSHGDTVFGAPDGWKVTARSGSLISAIENTPKHLYGVQFHPEVELTQNGMIILRNFLIGIAGFSARYTIADRRIIAMEYIRSRIGPPPEKILVLVSGGVDSTVCAALCTEAIGADRVLSLYINNGFMRLDESAKVKEALSNAGIQAEVLDASEDFYAATTDIPSPSPLINLVNNGEDESIQDGTKKVKVADQQMMLSHCLDQTIDPEEKRQIIGDTFMRVAQKKIVEMNLDLDHVYLAQGTLRPDLIESASRSVSQIADKIKTHHNDTDLVRALRMKNRIIEPLADYHKDEVRVLGLDLNLPESLVYRQPFPGPGLAIRILCNPGMKIPPLGQKELSSNAEGTLSSQMAPDHSLSPPVLIDIYKIHSLNEKLHTLLSPQSKENHWLFDQLIDLPLEEKKQLEECAQQAQISAYVLPILSVGVQGDGRSYKYVCALSSETQPVSAKVDGDGLNITQNGKETHWDVLFTLAKLIPKIFHDINRVVFVFGPRLTSAPLTTTRTYLTKDVIQQLQKVDDIANEILTRENLHRKLSQVPIILIPVPFDHESSRSIVIRPIVTKDFMTGKAAIPGVDIEERVLNEIVDKLTVLGISRVLYDLTSKPPATTEWE